MGLFDIFKKKDRVIEDFDNALKKGIITEEEHKMFIEKYNFGFIGAIKEQLNNGEITKAEYKDQYDEFNGRAKGKQQAANAIYAIYYSIPGVSNRLVYAALFTTITLYYASNELSEKDYEKIANEISSVDDENLILVFRILKIFGDLEYKVKSVDIHLSARCVREEMRVKKEKALKEHQDYINATVESIRERKQIINDSESGNGLREFVMQTLEDVHNNPVKRKK